jgi:hypothetical protein
MFFDLKKELLKFLKDDPNQELLFKILTIFSDYIKQKLEENKLYELLKKIFFEIHELNDNLKKYNINKG